MNGIAWSASIAQAQIDVDAERSAKETLSGIVDLIDSNHATSLEM
jgi:hypothetical protein